MENISARIMNDSLVESNVNIQFILKNGKVFNTINKHNTGTIYICEYLRDALAGDYVINKRPGLIIPFYEAGTEKRNIGHGSTYQGNVKKVDFNPESDTKCSMTLTFLIGSELSAGQRIDGFRLYGLNDVDLKDENKHLYAELDLGEDYIEVTSGVNLKVN